MLRFGTRVCVRSFLGCTVPPVSNTIHKEKLLINVQTVRFTGFFNTLTQEQLWKGVTSVSNAGKRRGRGKGADKLKRDLNLGQKVGKGKIPITLPGLNSGVFNKREIKVLADAEPRVNVSPALTKKRSRKQNPLDRGWSGRQIRGKKLGPPEPIQDETFDDFQSICLEHKIRVRMTPLGKAKKYVTMVAVGNSNGIIGLAVAKGNDSKMTLNLAKKRASKRLLTIDLIDKKTVNHDFYSVYGSTRLFVHKKPEGYGLKCHRAIIALCQLLGIENLHAKVEGSVNLLHMVRAFISGLMQQRTYQEIADDKKMHLVEFRKESHYYPKVLASPKECLSQKEAWKTPEEFSEYIMGKLPYVPMPKRPFYEKLPSWSTHLKKTLYKRNHHQVKLELLVKYGTLRSHLTDIYPECIHPAQPFFKKKEEEESS